MYKSKIGGSLRDRITESLGNLGESCLRIGSYQDNIISYFNSTNTSTSIDSPNVIESSYMLMNMVRSRIRAVLYGLLIMLNMPDEALVLRKFWSDTPTKISD